MAVGQLMIAFFAEHLSGPVPGGGGPTRQLR